jgi:hypothetical protein
MMIDENTIQLILIVLGFIFIFTRYWPESDDDSKTCEAKQPSHKQRKQRWKKVKTLKDSDSESESDIVKDPDYVSEWEKPPRKQRKQRKQHLKKVKTLKDSDSESESDIVKDPDYESNWWEYEIRNPDGDSQLQ